jgi:hypothetical protein
MLGVDTILGLPVHALVVHFAVALVPLAALGVIATAWRREWRHRYMLPLAVIAVVGAGAAFAAAQSGESLEHTVRDSARETGASARFGEHPEQGDRAEILAFAFALSAVGLYTIEQPSLKRFRIKSSFTTVGVAACTVLALLAFGSMVIAGHSGAELVWKDLGNFVHATQ